MLANALPIDDGELARGCSRRPDATLDGPAPQRVEALFPQSLGRKGEHRAEGFGRQLGVVLPDLSLRPSGGEEPEKEVDRQPCPADHRLSGEDFRLAPECSRQSILPP